MASSEEPGDLTRRFIAELCRTAVLYVVQALELSFADLSICDSLLAAARLQRPRRPFRTTIHRGTRNRTMLT